MFFGFVVDLCSCCSFCLLISSCLCFFFFYIMFASISVTASPLTHTLLGFAGSPGQTEQLFTLQLESLEAQRWNSASERNSSETSVLLRLRRSDLPVPSGSRLTSLPWFYLEPKTALICLCPLRVSFEYGQDSGCSLPHGLFSPVASWGHANGDLLCFIIWYCYLLSPWYFLNVLLSFHQSGVLSSIGI